MLEVLQVAGWVLTLLGQIQVTRKRRVAFVSWGISNTALLLVNVSVRLYWGAAMFLANLVFCVWSYRQWTREERQ